MQECVIRIVWGERVIGGGLVCSQGNCGCYTEAPGVSAALQVLLTPFLSFWPKPPPKGTGGSGKEQEHSHSLVGVWLGMGSTPHFSFPVRLK